MYHDGKTYRGQIHCDVGMHKSVVICVRHFTPCAMYARFELIFEVRYVALR